MIGLTDRTNIITFLPEIIYPFISKDSIKLMRIAHPLKFNIYTCMSNKSKDVELATFFEEFIEVFNEEHDET